MASNPGTYIEENIILIENSSTITTSSKYDHIALASKLDYLLTI